jgi:lytic cellulose monooxygenase (C1-hydroxylating)
MKSTFVAALTALAAREVAGHALFQQLWVDGTDYISQALP